MPSQAKEINGAAFPRGCRTLPCGSPESRGSVFSVSYRRVDRLNNWIKKASSKPEKKQKRADHYVKSAGKKIRDGYDRQEQQDGWLLCHAVCRKKAINGNKQDEAQENANDKFHAVVRSLGDSSGDCQPSGERRNTARLCASRMFVWGPTATNAVFGGAGERGIA